MTAYADVPERGRRLYAELDLLHGEVLRAKYRLTTNPDDEKLAELVTSIKHSSAQITLLWQAYETQDRELIRQSC